MTSKIKKVIIIPTEKKDENDMFVLSSVLRMIFEQVDEIILIKNYAEDEDLKFVPAYTTQLFCKKDNEYMASSVRNKALEYIKEKYNEPISITFLDDDCLLGGNYFNKIHENLKEKTIHGPFMANVKYEEDLKKFMLMGGDVDQVTPPSVKGQEDVISSLEYVIESLEKIDDRLTSLSCVGTFIWDPQCDSRFDEIYNGHWGYEDTDFQIQMLSLGYKIVPRPDVIFWHVNTYHKQENRAPDTHLKTPNRAIFYSKWKNLK